MFPLPVANDDGTIPVGKLYAMRLQGADFDGDAVTAFKERGWIAAQKRNTGKSYMVIPVNTESTEKDKTLVTDQSFESFCENKVNGLSNRVGLIATSLKYFFSQCANAIREGVDPEVIIQMIVDHACAMGDDIDEFKHGKAKNDLVPFEVVWSDGTQGILYGPYFNRYAKKYRSKEDFDKAVYNKKGGEKKPGYGILDTYAVAMEGGAAVYAEIGDAEPLALLPEGTALAVTGLEGEWVAVDCDGRAAWVEARCVTLTDELPQALTETVAEPEEPAMEMGTEIEETVEESEEALVIEEEPVGEESVEQEPAEEVEG